MFWLCCWANVLRHSAWETLSAGSGRALHTQTATQNSHSDVRYIAPEGFLPRAHHRSAGKARQVRQRGKRVLLRLYACSLLSRITMSKICSLSAEKEAGLCFRWEYSSASDIEVTAEFIIPDSSGHCKKGRIEFTQWLNRDIAIITASIFGVPRKRRPLDLFPVCGHLRIRLRVCRQDHGAVFQRQIRGIIRSHLRALPKVLR